MTSAEPGARPHAGTEAAAGAQAGTATGAPTATPTGAAASAQAGAPTGAPTGAQAHVRTDAGPGAETAAATDAEGRAGRARRELGLVLAACGAGGAAALVASGRVWLHLAAPRTPPLPPLSVGLSGRDIEPLVPALGVVGLAALVALLATRRWGRALVGALLAAAGLVLVLRSLPHLAAPTPGQARDLLLDQGRATGEPPGVAVTATASRVWPAVAALGGLLLVCGGLGALLRSRRWPGMSARYDRPAGGSAATPGASSPAAPAGVAPDEPAAGAVWEALDRGEDPTVG